MISLNVSEINNISLGSTEVDGLLRRTDTEHVILASTLALIMIFAIFGNIALITTIHCKASLHTLTNRFILNLACADVGVGLFCIPFSVVTCYTGEWIFGNIMCQLNGFMNILFSLASVFTLTVISVEKYFSIVKPMVVVITTKVSWIMIAMTWMAALSFAVIPLTGFTAFDFKTGSTQCGVQVPSTLGQTVYAFLVFAAAFLLPFGIMAFCYMNIFRTARSHDKRLHRMSRINNHSDVPLSSQNQIAATIFILLIVFVLCWTPYFVYMVYMTAHMVKNPDKHLQNLGLASYWCIYLNSCLNPLVYGVRNPLIRRELSWVCCPRYFSAQRQSRLQRTCAEKRQFNSVHFTDPYMTTNAARCPDNNAPVYPAYVNVVPLTEETIIGSNQDIVERTKDEHFDLSLQVKLSNCSSDPGYCSQEESGRACSGGGASDESNDNSNSNSSDSHAVQISSKANKGSDDCLDHRLNSNRNIYETPALRSSDVSCCVGKSRFAGFLENQGFTAENSIADKNINVPDTQEEQTQIFRGSGRGNQSTDFVGFAQPNARNLSTSPTDVLVTPATPRRWSIKMLGTRLKLGWIESAL